MASKTTNATFPGIEALMTTPEDRRMAAALGVSEAVKEEKLHQAVIPTPNSELAQMMNTEFRKLIVNYCASLINAFDLSQVSWTLLAQKLGTKPEFVQEAAEEMESKTGNLWMEVLGERIRRANASKMFRDIGWERLEAGAVAKMLYMLDRNLIRDVGELNAIAATARRAMGTPGTNPSGGNMQVNVNVGTGMTPDNGLPPSGHKMTIDLSPRTASALQRARERDINGGQGRVIDSKMLDAEELRGVMRERLESAKNPDQQVTEFQPLIDGE